MDEEMIVTEEDHERMREYIANNPGHMMLILDAIFKDEFGPGERISESIWGNWNPYIDFLERLEKEEKE